MGLNRKKDLTKIAKIICRQLRNKSTLVEKIFWEAVRNRKFENKKFYRQYPFFYDLNGRESFFVGDFFCFEEKMIIELDGQIHNYKLAKDEKRTEILNLLGLKLIRFTNKEVENNLEKVLTLIKNEFKK